MGVRKFQWLQVSSLEWTRPPVVFSIFVMLTGNSSSRKEASDGSCLLNRVPSLFIRLLDYLANQTASLGRDNFPRGNEGAVSKRKCNGYWVIKKQQRLTVSSKHYPALWFYGALVIWHWELQMDEVHDLLTQSMSTVSTDRPSPNIPFWWWQKRLNTQLGTSTISSQYAFSLSG